MKVLKKVGLLVALLLVALLAGGVGGKVLVKPPVVEVKQKFGGITNFDELNITDGLRYQTTNPIRVQEQVIAIDLAGGTTTGSISNSLNGNIRYVKSLRRVFSASTSLIGFLATSTQSQLDPNVALGGRQVLWTDTISTSSPKIGRLPLASSTPESVASSTTMFTWEPGESLTFRIFENTGSYGTQYPVNGCRRLAGPLNCETATSTNVSKHLNEQYRLIVQWEELP